MSTEEIINNAFSFGSNDDENTEKVYDLMLSDGDNRICVGSWTDEDVVTEAMHKINEVIKTADKVRGLSCGLRVYHLTPEEKNEYLNKN